MKPKIKKLPFYRDLIIYKFRFDGSTFVIGLALPDGIDVDYPCYYLYRYDRSRPGCYDQIVGHPDLCYIKNYFVEHFIHPILY